MLVQVITLQVLWGKGFFPFFFLKLWRNIFVRNVGNNMLSEIWAYHRDHCEVCAYKCNFEARSRNHCCGGKSVSTTYSLCVSVALIIQHVKRMRRTILPSVACLELAYFSIYLINGKIFGKKLLNTKCVFWFSLQLLSETFLILRRNERDMISNVYGSSCAILVIVRF